MDPMRNRPATTRGRSALGTPVRPAPVSPPIEPRQQLLPFYDPALSWSYFQQLCAAVARSDGYTQVEEYGRPGQKQYGIDLYASALGRRSGVYQVRRIPEISPADLSAAVDEYVREGSRLSAGLFVLCVAGSALDTRLTDRLVELNDIHAPLEVRLYGRERISELLRDQPEVVRVFFGDAWARAFCSTPDAAAALDVEALLRGPVNAFGLQAAVGDATRLDESDPAAAAALYEGIAERLLPQYPLQATSFRKKAAHALGRSMRWDEAFDRWMDLAMGELWDDASPELGSLYESGFKSAIEHVDSVRLARLGVIQAWLRWHEQPTQRASLAAAFDELYRARDPFAVRAGVLCVESHLADADLAPIRERQAMLAELCSELGTPDRVRLRIGLADAVGAEPWHELFGSATRRELPVRDAAYVALRAGRWFAWAGEFERAETAYRRAVELGAEARLELDVRSALRSLTCLYATSRRSYGQLGPAHEAARSVEGTRSYAPQHRRAREYALRALANERDHPEAHKWLRHNLWAGVIGGDLSDELETLRELGALYESSGDAFSGHALDAYVRAGHADGAKRVGSQLRGWVDLTAHLRAGAPWQQRTALEGIAAEGDLVPDTSAQALVPTLVSLLATDDIDRAPAAAAVAASIAFQLRLEDAMRLLDGLARYGPREPHHYRLTDRGLLRFAGRTYQRHPELREQLAALIAEVIRGGSVDSDLRNAVLACRDDPQPMVTALLQQVGDETAVAGELLALLDVEHASAVERGRQRLAEIMVLPPAKSRSRHTLGATYAVPRTVLAEIGAPGISAYATKLCDIAVDLDELVMNRAGALRALAQASESFSASEKARCRATVLPLARGTRISKIEEQQREANHPLSRFRIAFGSTEDVQAAAIEAATRLSTTAEERQEVLTAAIDLIDRPDAARALAFTLAVLYENGIAVDPRFLAAMQEAALRQAAVTIWAHEPTPADLGRQFAGDPATAVRAQLARSLDQIGRIDARLAAELRERLARDPSAAVRWLASRHDGSSSAKRWRARLKRGGSVTAPSPNPPLRDP
jgi:hypothetical protein